MNKIKTISISLILAAFISVLAYNNSFASEDFFFKSFKLENYPQSEPNNLVEQIQGFAFRTRKELDNCYNTSDKRAENQVFFCTNIHEADRLRMGYLAALNSNLKEPAEDEENPQLRMFYSKEEDQADDEEDLINMVTNSFDERKFSEFNQKTTAYHQNFLLIAERSFKKCELGITNKQLFLDRLTALNQDVPTVDKNRIEKPACNIEDLSVDASKEEFCTCLLTEPWNNYEHPFKHDSLFDQEVKTCTKEFENEKLDEGENTKARLQKINSILERRQQEIKQQNDDKKGKFYPLDCTTPQKLLDQFSNQDRIKYILANQKPNLSVKWLPFNKYEQKYFKLSDEELKQTDQIKMGLIMTECGYRGIDTIKCSITRAAARSVDLGTKYIKDFLQIKLTPVTISKIKIFHDQFKSIANIILVFVFILIILGQILGKKTLMIKTLMPKLIISTIFINLSFFLIITLIDISNILGDGISAIFESILKPFSNQPINAVNIAANILTSITAGAAIYLAAANINLLIFVIVVIIALLALFMLFILLTFRNIFIIASLIIAPLLISLSILPGTKKIFNKWLFLIPSIFFMYPLTITLKSIGDLLAIIIASSNNPFVGFIVIFFQFSPLIIIPKILISTTQKIPMLGNKVSSVTGFTNKQQQRLKKSRLYQQAQKSHQQKIAQKERSNSAIFGRVGKAKRKVAGFISPNAPLLDYYQDTDHEENRKEIKQYIDEFRGNNELAFEIVKKIVGEKSNSKIDPNSHDGRLIKNYDVNDPMAVLAAFEKASESGKLTQEQINKVFLKADSSGLDLEKFKNKKTVIDSLSKIRKSLDDEGKWENASYVESLISGREEPVQVIDYIKENSNNLSFKKISATEDSPELKAIIKIAQNNHQLLQNARNNENNRPQDIEIYQEIYDNFINKLPSPVQQKVESTITENNSESNPQ